MGIIKGMQGDINPKEQGFFTATKCYIKGELVKLILDQSGKGIISYPDPENNLAVKGLGMQYHQAGVASFIVHNLGWLIHLF